MSDLISREALKKAYFNAINETSIGEVSIIDLINNAPTVDTYTIEDIQEVRENALILGAKLAQRPQGEWVKDEEHSITIEMFKCTICGFWNGAEHFRFCPNCGAKMHKGGTV